MRPAGDAAVTAAPAPAFPRLRGKVLANRIGYQAHEGQPDNATNHRIGEIHCPLLLRRATPVKTPEWIYGRAVPRRGRALPECRAGVLASALWNSPRRHTFGLVLRVLTFWRPMNAGNS